MLASGPPTSPLPHSSRLLFHFFLTFFFYLFQGARRSFGKQGALMSIESENLFPSTHTIQSPLLVGTQRLIPLLCLSVVFVRHPFLFPFIASAISFWRTGSAIIPFFPHGISPTFSRGEVTAPGFSLPEGNFPPHQYSRELFFCVQPHVAHFDMGYAPRL